MQNHEIATLGGGCFWCLEAVYDEMQGVLSVESGYMGGHVKNPGYREVCTGTTGHAEVAQLKFDPAVLSTATSWKSSSPFTTPPRPTARATTWARNTVP